MVKIKKESKSQKGYIILQKGAKKEKHTLEGFCGSLYISEPPNKIELPKYSIFAWIFKRKKIRDSINYLLVTELNSCSKRFNNKLFEKIYDMYLNKNFGKFKGIITSRSEQHINTEILKIKK